MSSRPRSFQARLARLEAQRSRAAPQPLLLMRQYAGETRDTALAAAGCPRGICTQLSRCDGIQALFKGGENGGKLLAGKRVAP